MKTYLEGNFLVFNNSLVRSGPGQKEGDSAGAGSDLHVEVLGVVERASFVLVVGPAPLHVAGEVVCADELPALRADGQRSSVRR